MQIRTDDEGEILARSNHVFAGYWQQPAESAKVLADGWFRTGDKGHVEAGDYLVISDRKKDVIISGGENVSSVEVEDCLYQHPAVAEVAVIGVPHDKWGETVTALVVLRDRGHEATEQDLIEHCRDRLAHFKCPTSVEMRDDAAQDGDRQAAEVQAAHALLGRLRPGHQPASSEPDRSRRGGPYDRVARGNGPVHPVVGRRPAGGRIPSDAMQPTCGGPQ